jgi:hypothetical protein
MYICTMNYYEIGQEVIIENNDNKIIVDYEFVYDRYIYYMNDKSCYPEDKIFMNQLHKIHEYFINSAIEERDRIFLESNKKLMQEIKSKQTDPAPSRKRPLLSSLFDFLRRGF